MTHTFKGLAATAALSVLLGCSPSRPVQASETESISAHQYNANPAVVVTALDEVSQVRRLLRSACEPLRNAGSEGTETVLPQVLFAIEQTDRALALWQNLVDRNSLQPPQSYAACAQWHEAARRITLGIEEMLQRTQMGQPAPAFHACGRMCGQCVEMNAQAGVRRTSDVLFHFRRSGRALAQPVVAGDTATLKPALESLSQLRDEAVRDPIGGIGTPPEKSQALTSFSLAVDAFIQAVQDDKARHLEDRHKEMMKAMEQAYDLFL